MAIRYARANESTTSSAPAGWHSHFVNSRTASPWVTAVWIQSMCGRRRAGSMGPVAPIRSMGTRSR